MPISDLELYENLLWEAITIVDICAVRKSERNILNKLSRNLSHFSITVLALSLLVLWEI
jgi:hypothetical protein